MSIYYLLLGSNWVSVWPALNFHWTMAEATCEYSQTDAYELRSNVIFLIVNIQSCHDRIVTVNSISFVLPQFSWQIRKAHWHRHRHTLTTTPSQLLFLSKFHRDIAYWLFSMCTILAILWLLMFSLHGGKPDQIIEITEITKYTSKPNTQLWFYFATLVHR